MAVPLSIGDKVLISIAECDSIAIVKRINGIVIMVDILSGSPQLMHFNNVGELWVNDYEIRYKLVDLKPHNF